MNKIEQMHFDAIDKEMYIVEEDTSEHSDLDINCAVSNCVAITESIAIQFADWIWKNCDEEYVSQHSWENLFKEFLKTK